MSALELAALQRALAAEQAIVYGYAVLGAHVEDTARDLVTGVWNAHRQRRDELAGFITAAGAVPVTPRVTYALPFPVTDAASAQQLAAHLESGGAGAAWDLVTATSPGSAARHLAVTWLSASAVDEVRVAGAVPAALPGAPGSASSTPPPSRSPASPPPGTSSPPTSSPPTSSPPTSSPPSS